jgi:putative spermidine/putrescine transport system permease protein
MSPLVLPGVIIGVGILMVASKTGGVGGFPIVIASHVLIVLPFVLRSILISLENMDVHLEKAAAILGANATKRFFYVTLPLLKPGIGAGILFALIMSVNEFTVSLFVTARSTQTMPVVLFNYTMAYIDPTIAAVSTVYIVVTIATIWLLNRVVGIATLLKLEEQS